MTRFTFNTKAGIEISIIRIIAGLIILPHGAQKLLGSFGGYGFNASMDYFTSSGLPWIIGFLVIMFEFFGSLMLIFGVASRIAAISGLIVFTGALMIHLPNGFFMNWFGQQAGEGIQFHLLLLAMYASIAISGSGKFSLDSIFQKKLGLVHV